MLVGIYIQSISFYILDDGRELVQHVPHSYLCERKFRRYSIDNALFPYRLRAIMPIINARQLCYLCLGGCVKAGSRHESGLRATDESIAHSQHGEQRNDPPHISRVCTQIRCSIQSQ
jgi:hypothetical protein